MSVNQNQPGKNRGANLLTALSQWAQLVGRLMADPRVNPLLKLLPVGALIYLISPLDFLIGPIDDAAVIWAGTQLFVEMCPPAVVQEHRAALGLGGTGGAARPHEDVVDAEFREVK